MTDQFRPEEEPWELEIQDLLGSLPSIDPPQGFIAKALNRRPLFAGRLGLSFALLACGVVGASLATGWFGPREVVPELASITQQHEMSSASLFGGLSTVSSPLFEAVDSEDAATPVTLPPSWDHAANYSSDDLTQALYAEGDEAVSVFAERGRVAWDGMSEAGRTTINGYPAWVDPDEKIVVMQAADSVVTVVGLTPNEVANLIGEMPGEHEGFWNTALDVANGLATSVGFPES